MKETGGRLRVRQQSGRQTEGQTDRIEGERGAEKEDSKRETSHSPRGTHEAPVSHLVEGHGRLPSPVVVAVVVIVVSACDILRPLVVSLV